MNKNIIYTFDEQTKEKNQYELKDFLEKINIDSDFCIQIKYMGCYTNEKDRDYHVEEFYNE
jgi:hypothetical protein